LAVLRGLVERISDRRYEDRRVEVFPAASCSSTCSPASARTVSGLAFPAALICRLRDGKIARLDEYLDSAHVTRFRSGRLTHSLAREPVHGRV
jgi:hypothetical protein